MNFISYTKGTIQFVTVPHLETQFLDWLNSVDSSAGFIRETTNKIAVRCSPTVVRAVAKKEAVILSLVEKAKAE